MLEFRIDNSRRGGWNLVTLEWEQVFDEDSPGRWQIVFHRYYRGEGEPITYIFDNRSFNDPFWRGHQITVRNIARQIWWGCNGYQVNDGDLQFLRNQIADFVMTRPFLRNTV